MRPHLVLVHSREVPVDERSARETIDRLTQGTHGVGPTFVFLPQEGEVLRRALKDRMFSPRDLNAVEQLLREMDPERCRRRKRWSRQKLEEYVQSARDAQFNNSIDNMLLTLQCHLHDVEREPGMECRRSLLRAALVAFLNICTPTKTNTNNRTLRLTG